MSVIQLKREDARADEKLVLTYEQDWSARRSAHSEREVFAYNVNSDSGNTYETEVFISDLGTACGYCNCPARVACRHIKAVLYDVLCHNPAFCAALGWRTPATLKEAAEAALKTLIGSDREHALVTVDRPNYTICDMLREALGHPPQDRSDW